MFKLTKGQTEALSKIKNLKKGESFLLNGSAGTGKTEVANRIDGTKMAVAFTHKAVEVLRKRGVERTATIHSFCDMCRNWDADTKEYKYTFNINNTKNPYINKLIVDEASMIDDYLLNALISMSKAYNFSIIFVGDDKQLPPINEVISPIFSIGIETHTLDQIVRHDNDIITLSRNFKNLKTLKDGEHFKKCTEDNLDITPLLDSNGADDAKYICYTNAQVAAVNSVVRTLIYGKDVKPFELGETILLTSPVLYQGEVKHKNNEEVKISSIEEIKCTSKLIPSLKLDTWLLNETIQVLNVEKSGQRFKEAVKFLTTRYKQGLNTYKDVIDFKETFATYQYNHALTTHRAQGSTYKETFVDTLDIAKCWDKDLHEKLLYTAITRASDNVNLIA